MDTPKQPIQAMSATSFDADDYVYVIDADGALWSIYVSFNGSTWKRVPMKTEEETRK